MAWAGVAQAEEPCGAGVDTESFKYCEVVQECNDACKTSQMAGACIAAPDQPCAEACTGALEATCEASCSVACEASCTVGIVDPDPTECKCESSCSAGCVAVCAGVPDNVGCLATCEANCESSCTVVVTNGCECSATCDATCEASCELFAASCESCESDYMGACTTQMAASCLDKCQDGVILCDDSYVDANDIDHCISALEQGGATIKRPSSSADGLEGDVARAAEVNGCSVQDQAKLGFAGAFFTFAGFGLAGAFLRRRRS